MPPVPPQSDEDLVADSSEEASFDNDQTTETNPNGPVITTECAFLVYLDQHGHWIANNNLDTKLISGRTADGNDVFVATSVIKKDIQAQETVVLLMSMQQQMAVQAMQQQRNQQIAQNLGGSGIDLSKIRNPNS